MSEPPGRASPAVQAEALYLINLLLLPGLAFLLLLALFRRPRDNADPLVRGHVRQAFAASLLAGHLRQLKDHDLEEAASTRLLVYAASLIAAGCDPVTACDAALVASAAAFPMDLSKA